MRQKSNHRDYVFYLILLLALLGFFWFFTSQRSTVSVPYSQMVELFQAEQVSSFTVQNNVVTMELKTEVDGKKEASCAISDFTAFYEDLNPLVQTQKKSGVLTSYDYKKDTQSVNWVTLLPSLLSVAMVFLLLMMMVRQNNANGGGGGLSQFGKAKFTSAEQMKKKVSFHDVAGAQEEKAELLAAGEENREVAG